MFYMYLCLFRDNKELEEVKMSLGNLLKELEQIRATLTVHIDVRLYSDAMSRHGHAIFWGIGHAIFVSSCISRIKGERVYCTSNALSSKLVYRHASQTDETNISNNWQEADQLAILQIGVELGTTANKSS